MRHEHLVVTVDSGTKARIEEDLDPGETVEAWVADAIDAKLATEDAEDGAETGASGGNLPNSDETDAGNETVESSDAETNPDDSDESDDDYDEGFEYVDDCAI